MNRHKQFKDYQQPKIVITNSYAPQNKFNFSDHKLAVKVRSKMREHVARVDENGNGELEVEEIQKLLLTLFNESVNEVSYVTKNVFRYDRDNDGKITYEEFVNFSVQQHFGQLSIQRFHKQGKYSKGSSRIMNSQEFCRTLQSCLEGIQSPGNEQTYRHLFQQVDLDRDGWISYEDYFYFLRQYFGSKSYAASISNIKVEEHSEPEFRDGNNETPEQRIARLIYAQLKISVMLRDANKNLHLERPQVQKVLSETFGLQGYECGQVLKRIMGRQEVLQYEKFMKDIVVYYLCEVDIQRNYPNIHRIEKGSFPLMFCKSCSFVEIKPADHILQQLFEKTDADRDGYISLNEYTNMINKVFENFEFDSRGIPRNKRKVVY